MMGAVAFAGEQQVVRILMRLLSTFGKPVLDRRALRRSAEQSVRLAGGVLGGDVVDELGPEDAAAVAEYLGGQEIGAVAQQMYLARLFERSKGDAEELLAACREQIRLGLRRRVDVGGERLFELTEVVFREVLLATRLAWRELDGQGVPSTTIGLALGGRVTAAALRNTELLAGLTEVTGFRAFARELAAQVARRYARMRLPHARTSRTVPYDRLYVQPGLAGPQGDVDLLDAVRRGQRLVVLGAPGAGKSTLAAKLVHDLATAGEVVPFPLVLRELTEDLGRGGRTVARHLEALCRAPYNLEPPPGAVEFLLLNGGAVVVFDGLDELVDTSLRVRVVSLIEGFLTRYPLVPVVVTSRVVGYDAAPLEEGLAEVVRLADFHAGQVWRYAANWFALDDSLPPGESRELRDAFVRDSALVPDLRGNPLMLSLLCGMYATRRYLPQNRPKVFEDCALLLFDEWDRGREIGGHVPFASRVRGAVQHLAWTLLTGARDGAGRADATIARRELADELAGEFFVKRLGDEDVARDEAERFVAYCTGRAWVLTDVGATRSEPRYGFTHRTFLEFFAAEYLVRSQQSDPERVFAALAPRLERGEWEVVGQLCVQLLERNADNGSDRFLAALAGGAASGKLLGFAARNAELFSLSRPTARLVLRRLLEHEEQRPPQRRRTWAFGLLNRINAPATFAFLHDLTPVDAAVVARELPGVLRDLAAEAPTAVAYLTGVGRMCGSGIAGAVRASGVEERPEVAARLAADPGLRAYACMSGPDEERARALRRGLAEFGGRFLYVMPEAYETGFFSSIAAQVVHDFGSPEGRRELFAREIDAFLARADPRPWYVLAGEAVRSTSTLLEGGDLDGAAGGVVALALHAPAAELHLLPGAVARAKCSAGLRALVRARETRDPAALGDRWQPGDTGAHRFVRAWVRGEVSTVAP